MAETPAGDLEKVDGGSLESGLLECAVCLQTCVFPVQLPCRHIFCYLCVKGVTLQSRRCAMCRAIIPTEFLNNPDLLLPCKDIEKDYKAFEDGYQWFYEGRNGWWQYDERTSMEIENHHKNGAPRVELLIAGFLYVIDFENEFQYRRTDPSRRRRIKRDLASGPKKGVAGIRIEADEGLGGSDSGGVSPVPHQSIDPADDDQLDGILTRTAGLSLVDQPDDDDDDDRRQAGRSSASHHEATRNREHQLSIPVITPRRSVNSLSQDPAPPRSAASFSSHSDDASRQQVHLRPHPRQLRASQQSRSSPEDDDDEEDGEERQSSRRDVSPAGVRSGHLMPRPALAPADDDVDGQHERLSVRQRPQVPVRLRTRPVDQQQVNPVPILEPVVGDLIEWEDQAHEEDSSQDSEDDLSVNQY